MSTSIQGFTAVFQRHAPICLSILFVPPKMKIARKFNYSEEKCEHHLNSIDLCNSAQNIKLQNMHNLFVCRSTLCYQDMFRVSR